MRLLALLLVPAFIGLVRSQQGHGQGINFPDQGRAPGGASRNKPLDTYPDYPAMNGMMNMGAHGNVGTHVNAGTAPRGGSSRQLIPDYAPVAPGPVSNNVNHVQSGNVPPPGGSSRQTDAPNAPVQRGMFDQVNMVNAGAAPIAGQGNSGEFVDYGAGAVGAANNAPAAGGNSNGGGNNQVAYAAGGSSTGNGGPAYAAGPYSDNAGAAAPLGGAAISDLTQQEAGKAEHVSGAASVGSTIAGVVIAVIVLVGIVAVAAVFLVRQRQSRMTIASV